MPADSDHSAAAFDPAALQERVFALESVVTHLQRDVEQFHEVLLALQGELRLLASRNEQLNRRLEELTETPEIRSPQQEKPPHY